MTILVCSDRDGIINFDEDSYLGHSEDWKNKIKLLPGVIRGIKLIKSIPESNFFIITQQSGVALKDFPNLTEERMHEVNKRIIEELKEKGAIVDGYFACPFVNSSYAKGKSVNPDYVKENVDIKPGIGMIEKAASSLKLSLGEIKYKYVIGDRASDVIAGLNVGCKSILVSSFKTKKLGDLEKVKKLQRENSDRIYIASNFLDGIKWIVSDIRNSNR